MSLNNLFLNVNAVIGSIRKSIYDLSNIGEDTIIELESSIEEPVELYATDNICEENLIARGEIVVTKEDKLAIRVTKLIDRKDSLEVNL